MKKTIYAIAFAITIIGCSTGGEEEELDLEQAAGPAFPLICTYEFTAACTETTYFNAGRPAADRCCADRNAGRSADDFTWLPTPRGENSCLIRATVHSCYP